MPDRNVAKAADKTSAAGSSPIFFQTPRPLDIKYHAKSGVLPSQDFSFATETNSIPINAIEFVEAAKHYPIIFTHTDNPIPAVILGLERQNYFVDSKGKWKMDAYIPAYVRKYPFIFMDMTETHKQLLLCIDESAPQFKKAGGKNTIPLYENDKPSAITLQALEFCTAYHNHYIVTRQFCQAIKEADLLEPTQSNIKLANGREISLGGFQVIDEKKLNALSDDKILEFHKKGWLPLIYFSLMSASCWKKLVDIASKLEN